MLANRESQKLGHSKSSDDLKASAAAGVGVMQENTVEEVQRSLRPLKDRLRRRSTLNWISSAPQSRQQKLEDATIEHMADMWFSLHCDGVDDPVYISEIAEKAMNPLFKSFDLGVYGPLVTRQEQFTIKFWARAHSMENFMLLLDLRVSLRSLQFVGKNVRFVPASLPLFLAKIISVGELSSSASFKLRPLSPYRWHLYQLHRSATGGNAQKSTKDF